jgi:hypothetical protein
LQTRYYDPIIKRFINADGFPTDSDNLDSLKDIDGFQLIGGYGWGYDAHIIESNTKPINSSSQSSENIPRRIGFAAKSNNIFRNSILFKKK